MTDCSTKSSDSEDHDDQNLKANGMLGRNTMPPSDQTEEKSREGSDWSETMSNSPSLGAFDTVRVAYRRIRRRD